MRGISWLAANQLASQEGLCTMEWVSKYIYFPRFFILLLLCPLFLSFFYFFLYIYFILFLNFSISLRHSLFIDLLFHSSPSFLSLYYVYSCSQNYEKRLLPLSCNVCLSVRMEQLSFHWTDFHEILYLNNFRTSVKKIQVLLKSEKNPGYFTWRPV